MDKSQFPIIYKTPYGSVARLGGKEFESFCFLTASQGIVSKKIAVHLTKDEAECIIASDGDANVIAAILKSDRGYIEID